MSKCSTNMFITVNKNEYLQNVLNRIDDDIEPYVRQIKETIKNTSNAPGVFALIRMVFPIIDAISRPLSKTPQQLLGELNVPLPNLYWCMFRDGFVHNDEFLTFQYGDFKISPAIVTGLEGEIIQHHSYSNPVTLSLFKLVSDLKDYIERELKTPETKISRVGGVMFSKPGTVQDKKSKKYKELLDIVADIKALRSSSEELAKVVASGESSKP